MKILSHDFIRKEVTTQLQQQLKLKNSMMVPRLEKIILNCGLGEAKNNKNIIKDGIQFLELISGQKALKTIASVSVAGFKLREGMPIGAKVTLRKQNMIDFLNRFNNIYVPRIKDFNGLSKKSFDGLGNYTVGINDVKVFPEIPLGPLENLPGLSITFVTNASNNDLAYGLLLALGLAFAK